MRAMRSVSLWMLVACATAACTQQPPPLGDAKPVAAPMAAAPATASPAAVTPPANALTITAADNVSKLNGNQTQAGLKAYLDPVTGELGPPPDAAAGAAPPAIAGAAAAPVVKLQNRAPIEGRAVGGGVVEYAVPADRTIDEVACVQPDGSLGQRCSKATK